jgi:hypothetical protein
MKTIAIPARLLKEALTEDEKLELQQYGNQPLSEADLEQKRLDEEKQAQLKESEK